MFFSPFAYGTFRYMKPIDSGLLYYLNTDHTQVEESSTFFFLFHSILFHLIQYGSIVYQFVKGIAVKRSDLVGLIMRRNELAKDILKASITQHLPPMLQVHPLLKLLHPIFLDSFSLD